jgi:hypothetical protein
MTGTARIDAPMPIVSNICESATAAGKTSSTALGSLGAADWLSLAAAPTFIAMACATVFAERTQMTCIADQGAFPLTGMAMMYLLMGAFHLAPWLRLLGRRRR